MERLDRFVALLLTWQKTTNLISSSTVARIWTRHIADSLQLIELAPHARVWIDLGSGGGFPGVVIACALADQNGAAVHLVESNSKKAAFLREAVRVTDSPAIIHVTRAENFGDSFGGGADVVTARALAPLKSLLEWSYPLLSGPQGVLGVFPKGQDVEAELTEAAKYWNINHTLAPSCTDPKGRIVILRALARRQMGSQ